MSNSVPTPPEEPSGPRITDPIFVPSVIRELTLQGGLDWGYTEFLDEEQYATLVRDHWDPEVGWHDLPETVLRPENIPDGCVTTVPDGCELPPGMFYLPMERTYENWEIGLSYVRTRFCRIDALLTNTPYAISYMRQLLQAGDPTGAADHLYFTIERAFFQRIVGSDSEYHWNLIHSCHAALRNGHVYPVLENIPHYRRQLHLLYTFLLGHWYSLGCMVDYTGDDLLNIWSQLDAYEAHMVERRLP